MTVLQRIVREKVAIAGVLIALYSVSVAFDLIVLTNEQYGAIGGLAGAAVIVLRRFVSPANEVIAQQTPGESTPTAGQASVVETGAPVSVSITPLDG